MEFDQAERILRGFSIPLQPKIVSSLLNVIPDMQKMANVIEQDASLSAGVLKLVHSISKGHQQSIKSIYKAIHQLGISGITTLINAQLLHRASIEKTQKVMLTDYWRINGDVAFACSLLARHLNLQVVENAYYIGLFHNIGMPLMWQKHPDYFDSLLEKSEFSISDTENNKFNCSHAVIGYYIAKGMHLDNELCEAIRLHHSAKALAEDTSIDDEVKTMLCILKLAEYVIGEAAFLHGKDDEEEWELFEPIVVSHLSLSEHDLYDLRDILEDGLFSRQKLEG